MWRVWLQKYKNAIWAVTALALTFLAGWQAGRVTSPYYAAHPIVFSGPSPSGSPEDLHSLVVTATPKPAESSVAAATTEAPTVSGKFVGSVNSDKYHDPSCSGANQIKPANQVWFASREEAEATGYVPSACTKEKLGL